MKRESLIRKIRRYVNRRETYVSQRGEWIQFRKPHDLDADTVNRIAESAGCDWLMDSDGYEARFFEGN